MGSEILFAGVARLRIERYASESLLATSVCQEITGTPPNAELAVVVVALGALCFIGEGARSLAAVRSS